MLQVRPEPTWRHQQEVQWQEPQSMSCVCDVMHALQQLLKVITNQRVNYSCRSSVCWFNQQTASLSRLSLLWLFPARRGDNGDAKNIRGSTGRLVRWMLTGCGLGGADAPVVAFPFLFLFFAPPLISTEEGGSCGTAVRRGTATKTDRERR